MPAARLNVLQLRLLSLLLCVLLPAVAAAEGTRLLRRPTVSRDLVVFAYASDLWAVERTGGTARRLTSTPFVETDPHLSPDGSLIAFTATVGGNTDVYVMSALGGDPTRLTYHPGIDAARGWSPDGRRVIVASTRDTVPLPVVSPYFRLWTIGVERAKPSGRRSQGAGPAPAGGLPDVLPMPRAFTGAYSPDGRRLAYEDVSTAMFAPWAQEQSSQWRHYRGGRTHPIRVIDLASRAVEQLPWTDSNDSSPMWVGDVVYFLSDRTGTTNLFSYDTRTRELAQLTRHDDFDIMSASAGPDAIVYEQAGYIHLVDIATRKAQRLTIEVVADFPWARPQMKKVAAMIRSAALSPTGVRAVFEARGDIYTLPAEKGQARNLTASAGVHDRSPVWSPDGAQIAWLSDASGEYQLMLGEQTGTTRPRAIALPSNAFFSSPVWSPDGRLLLLEDNHLNLWCIDIASGAATKLDTDTYDDPGRRFDAAWSPDSRWVAYSKSLDSHLRAIFVYSIADRTPHQITDGLSDAISPVFDAGGKYLYFLASTNYALRTGWLEMSSVDRLITRAIYLAVLSASEPSPFLPETGDEVVVPPATAAAQPAGRPPADPKPPSPAAVRIDVQGIGQRILALAVPPADYSALAQGSAGTLFYAETPRAAGAPLTIHRYQLRERRAAPYLEGVRSYVLSADAKRLLYRADGNRWGIVPTDRPVPPRVGEGAIDVTALETLVDPRLEWAQIFRETWRIQREFFYDAAMHGADWPALYDKYSVLLPHVAHRADLGYLIASLAGELAVGHSYLIGEGDVPAVEPVSVGMLGADYAIENGRYRITKIYGGENWNPELQAPLSGPGIQVAEGDYLLEVNGRPLAPPTSVYQLFQGTAGKQTLLRVNSSPSLEGSRLVTVVPVASDDGLRTRAWIEGNRRLVDRLSGGRLAYVWLPNTAGPGFTAFNRYYYAQQHKEGAIIDVRYNQGGMVADYIVNELTRPLMGYFARREGKPSTSPTVGIYGPKVMIVNESAGSGGDALPYYFKQLQVGPIVGTRTWGALVGTLQIPSTIDGGGVTAPSLAFYDVNGRWAVENEGVAPDIEVEITPADAAAGRDPQLERAVQEALRLLEENPNRPVPRPAPIRRVSPPRR
jgi:tricorn protease